MAAKKGMKLAPKKAAKKAAKKVPGHRGEEKHDSAKDLRKAYEHLGRLHVLRPGLSSKVVAQVNVLSGMAQQALEAGEAKAAKDLLRASEHLAFGSLTANSKEARMGEALAAAVNAEYEHLVDKAEEHGERHAAERPAALAEVLDAMTEDAEAAFAKGAYRRALEFARGAEALAHVRGLDRALDAGKPQKKLKA